MKKSLSLNVIYFFLTVNLFLNHSFAWSYHNVEFYTIEIYFDIFLW